MSHKRRFLLIACLGAACVMAFTLIATSAVAQQQACVYIKVGAGFSGKMRVVSGSWASPWSSDMAIGGQRCQPLKNLADGAPYSVEFSADLGRTVTCSPANLPYNSKDPGTSNFFAWGTTLSVKCSQTSD